MERLERLTSRNEDCVSVNGHGLYHLTMTEVVQMADRLAAYEDTGLTPEEIKAPFTEDTMINLAAQALGVEPSRLRELAEADKDGRAVVLPCKVGERWTDEDGRAVRITAVIVSIEPFGTNINIYFDYEDATPDDAGSDCVTNWDYFSRHYTCIEVEDKAFEDSKEKVENSLILSKRYLEQFVI